MPDQPEDQTDHQPTDELAASVRAVHAALDRWHDVVVGVAREADGPDEAVADPRLEDAEAGFAAALEAFHGAAGDELGLTGDASIEGSGDSGEDAGDELLEGDIFFLQFFVGLPPETPPEALDGVLDLIDDGAFAVIGRLEEAGFVVPTFAASRGELTVDLLDEGDLAGEGEAPTGP